MNNTDTSSWPHNAPFDPHGLMPDEEFARFLDINLGDIDINFPISDSNLNDANAEASTSHDFSALLQDMEMGTFAGIYESQQLIPGNQGDHALQQFDYQQQYNGNTVGQQGWESGFVQVNGGQQYSKPQVHGWRQPHSVPPTPNSVEFYGNPAELQPRADPRELAALEMTHQSRGQDMVAFTPLASPAVTPYDYQVATSPAFTIPGAYFSPLTSPALQGQTQAYRSISSARPSTADSSVVASPIDFDVDMLGEAAQQPELSRRTKKKTTTPRRSTSSTRIRQSPIVKPQRRKPTLSSSFPPQEIDEMVRQVRTSNDIPAHSLSAGLAVSSGHEYSSAESVSPEPYSGSLMGPPPKPGSNCKSLPALTRVTSAPSGVRLSGAPQPSPVTPASLMKLRQQEELDQARVTLATTSRTEENVSQNHAPTMSDLSISDYATAARPSMTRSNTQIRDEKATPRLGTDKLSRSEALKAQVLSPLGPSAKPLKEQAQSQRPEISTGRGGKRRNGPNSTLVSPALRPRISPNIKPLLPDGAPSTEAHALLLATKSNYQNILEGTHVPGVHYPEHLCMNLTSKRTSHKLAEQGRRNRINVALQEMASLVPSPSLAARDKGDEREIMERVEGGGKAETVGSTSKAATVEAAIEYIHVLRRQLAEKDREISDMRARLEELGR